MIAVALLVLIASYDAVYVGVKRLNGDKRSVTAISWGRPA